MNYLPSTDVGFLAPVDVHFDDLDPMGMLHNSQYQVWVERAWLQFARGQGLGGASAEEQRSAPGGDGAHRLTAQPWDPPPAAWATL
ncbi:hypothetical protein ABT083_37905 [Streptomyces goshikiensis]|uniref:hypothetical protein n=1 Tax=Streptomyces goshikiensis TaxID=1942 RepID=UPI0033195612